MLLCETSVSLTALLQALLGSSTCYLLQPAAGDVIISSCLISIFTHHSYKVAYGAYSLYLSSASLAGLLFPLYSVLLYVPSLDLFSDNIIRIPIRTNILRVD